tara:strand:- start:3121 stop:3306 length:186 start_codon:yes stop_codon:yes gene_type:complete
MPLPPDEEEEDPVDQEEESVETTIKKAVLSKFQKKEKMSTVVPLEPKESYETVYIDEADFV